MIILRINRPHANEKGAMIFLLTSLPMRISVCVVGRPFRGDIEGNQPGVLTPDVSFSSGVLPP